MRFGKMPSAFPCLRGRVKDALEFDIVKAHSKDTLLRLTFRSQGRFGIEKTAHSSHTPELRYSHSLHINVTRKSFCFFLFFFAFLQSVNVQGP